MQGAAGQKQVFCQIYKDIQDIAGVGARIPRSAGHYTSSRKTGEKMLQAMRSGRVYRYISLYWKCWKNRLLKAKFLNFRCYIAYSALYLPVTYIKSHCRCGALRRFQRGCIESKHLSVNIKIKVTRLPGY